MALIKCTGCGHDVSDKASVCPHCGCPIPKEQRNICEECGEQIPDNATVCPNCGCPTGNSTGNVETVQEELHEEESPKKKWWIWALTAVLLCLLGGGGFYAYQKSQQENVESLNDSTIVEEKKDSVEIKEDIVELTPEFIKAIQKYDKLGVFSEGYAAVRNKENYNWGYINTKGEEVIPTTIEASFAGRFSEGMAFVNIDDNDFCVIDTKGKTLFKNRCENYIDERIEPYYLKGKLYVNVMDDKYAVFDKQGKRIGTVSEEEGKKYYRQNSFGNYSIFEKDMGGWSLFGLKDSLEKVVLPADYSQINGCNSLTGARKTDFNNGVICVELDEYGDGDGYEYYGYVDIKGNDTFSEEIKERCRKSREPTEYYNEDDVEDGDGSDWLQGRWVGEVDGYPMEVIIEGSNLIHKIGGRVCYNGSYEFNGDMLIYDNATAFWPVDKDRQVLTYDGKAMRKESGSSSYSSSSSSSYSSGSSRESSYRFSSAYDVMGYLSDKSFYNGERRLRIREDGVWFNDYCATGAPYVQRFESYKALVRAISSMGPTYGYIIDPVNNTVIDDTGDVFKLR